MRLEGPHFSFQDETPGSFVVVVVSFVGSGFSFKFLLFWRGWEIAWAEGRRERMVNEWTQDV